MYKTLFLSFALLPSLMAEEVAMQPTHVSLFTNGYGLVTLEGKLGDDATLRLSSLPVPSLGTFWIAAQSGAKIDRLVSGLFDYDVPLRPDTAGIAAANPGALVKITYRNADRGTLIVEGYLVELPKKQEAAKGNTIGQTYVDSKNPLLGSVIVIKTSEGIMSIEESLVMTIIYRDKMNFPRNTQKRSGVELQLAVPAPGALIEASCLSSGMTWQPSYRIDLMEGNKALLHAKATISNNLMDMSAVKLELIMGLPALTNPELVDPMALQGAAVAMRAEAWPRKPNMTGSSSVSSNRLSSLISAGSVSYNIDGPARQGVDTGNLYFYPVDSFSAKAGQVVTQPLFSSKFDYKNVYTWALGDPQNFPQPSVTLAKESTNEIWNCIRFTNPLNMPLTAAPVEFLEKGRIAGTNNLEFTPSKRECTVKMNRAAKMTTTKKSELTKQERIKIPLRNGTTKKSFFSSSSRSRSATKSFYEVSLGINNLSDETVVLEVAQNVQGKVSTVSESGVCTSFACSDNRYKNMDNTIRWNLELKPKESKNLKFSYEIIH